ncbi:MAG: hypothetical protein HFE63_00655 [Clostridiales bacterium]|nr:hypothetical protein [Clostridiales bacterium]
MSNKAQSSRYREVKHNSVIPYYVIAISWILFAALFPMYKLGHFIVIILISVAEFVILRHLIPPKVERIPLPYEAPHSGVDDVDNAINIGAEYIRKFDKISVELYKIDPTVADKLSDIREIMSTLFEYVSKNPDKLPKVRRFMNYYLPTLEKLMNTYIELSNQKVKGENINKTLSGITDILDTIKPAFERQLDNLYEDRAIDISADITVLENMLDSEGLKDVRTAEKNI